MQAGQVPAFDPALARSRSRIAACTQRVPTLRLDMTDPTLPTQPMTRPRVADQVFQALVRAILEGELKPGERLPTHRDLAQRYSVSPLLVRQAVHRLEELGLARVKQGSASIVLDPAEVMDLRLVQLQLELARPSERFVNWVFEAESLSTLPLLALAELRITAEELEQLKHIVDSADASTPDGVAQFRVAFWGAVTKATHNPLLQAQVRGWSTFAEKFARRPDVQAVTTSLFPKLYSGLCRTLGQRRGSVQLYQELITPILRGLGGQAGPQPGKGRADRKPITRNKPERRKRG